MKFLEQQLNDINTLREEPYVLAIMAYALAISGSKEKMKTYERLKNIAGGSEGRG